MERRGEEEEEEEDDDEDDEKDDDVGAALAPVNARCSPFFFLWSASSPSFPCAIGRKYTVEGRGNEELSPKGGASLANREV